MKNRELVRLVVIAVVIFSAAMVGYSADYPIKLSLRDAGTDLFKSDGLKD